jgi:hypothetical protein
VRSLGALVRWQSSVGPCFTAAFLELNQVVAPPAAAAMLSERATSVEDALAVAHMRLPVFEVSKDWIPRNARLLGLPVWHLVLVVWLLLAGELALVVDNLLIDPPGETAVDDIKRARVGAARSECQQECSS